MAAYDHNALAHRRKGPQKACANHCMIINPINIVWNTDNNPNGRRKSTYILCLSLIVEETFLNVVSHESLEFHGFISDMNCQFMGSDLPHQYRHRVERKGLFVFFGKQSNLAPKSGVDFT